MLGVHGKKRVITDHFIYTRLLFKILNATSSHVFTYVNKCPTQRHLVWDIRQWLSVFSFIVITHTLFINRSINRCTFINVFNYLNYWCLLCNLVASLKTSHHLHCRPSLSRFPPAAAVLFCKQKLPNRLSITHDPKLHKHCILSDPLTSPRGRLTGFKHG